MIFFSRRKPLFFSFKTIFLSLFVVFHTIMGLIQEGYEIHDLQETDPTCFQQEISFWSISAFGARMSTTCGGTEMLGGPQFGFPTFQAGIQLERTFYDLPSHQSIIISFDLYVIGPWNPSFQDKIRIQFGTLAVFDGWIIDGTTLPNENCSLNNKGSKMRVLARFPHISNSIMIAIFCAISAPASVRTFGVRDLSLYLSQENIPALEICGNPYATFTIQTQTVCPCPLNQHGPNSGSCTNCDAACKTCYGSGPVSCYECNDGYYFNGNECTSCDPSCKKCTSVADDDCTACYADYILHNGKCIYCPSGVVFEGFCVETSRCMSYPFTIDLCTKVCASPCLNPLDDISDANCVPQCPSNRLIDLDLSCQNCQSLNILYIERTQDGHLYSLTLMPPVCDLSIEGFDHYLDIQEEIPNSVQPFNYEIVNKTETNQFFIKIVLQASVAQESTLEVTLAHLNGEMTVPQDIVQNPPPEPEPGFEPEPEPQPEPESGSQPETQPLVIAPALPISEEALQASQISVSAILGGSLVGTVALGASSTVWSIVSFQQFVGYFIYINVTYPSHVHSFLLLIQSSVWDYFPNPLSSLIEPLLQNFIKEYDEEASQFLPPKKFVQYERTAFFIENGGTLIFTNVMLLVFLAIILVLKGMSRFQNRKFLKIVKVYLRWNVITRTYLENAIPLFLAICLQLRITVFDNAYLIVCAIFTYISIIYMFVMTVFIIKVLYKRENSLLKKGLIKRIYGTLHEGVILKRPMSKYYHIIIMFRGLLLVFLISFFEDYPLLQIVSLIFSNAGLVYYMMKDIQFERKSFDVITKIKEVLILFGEIALLLLVREAQSEAYYNIVGWFVLVCLASGFLMEIIYMLIIQVLEFRQVIGHIKTQINDIYSYIKSFCETTPNAKTNAKPPFPKLKTPERGRTNR